MDHVCGGAVTVQHAAATWGHPQRQLCNECVSPAQKNARQRIAQPWVRITAHAQCRRCGGCCFLLAVSASPLPHPDDVAHRAWARKDHWLWAVAAGVAGRGWRWLERNPLATLTPSLVAASEHARRRVCSAVVLCTARVYVLRDYCACEAVCLMATAVRVGGLELGRWVVPVLLWLAAPRLDTRDCACAMDCGTAALAAPWVSSPVQWCWCWYVAW